MASGDRADDELARVLSAPRWLRDGGQTAWLIVGLGLVLVGAVWLLSLTQVIVAPVIAAGVITAVASPVVFWLERHRVPRGVGAVLLLLALMALGMIVIQLLANSVLQQLVQPFAMGAALGIHPLTVLIVTLAAGSLFGAAGLILAAPITSTIVRVSADLSRAGPDPPAAPP